MVAPFNPLQGRLVGQQVIGKQPIAFAGGMRTGMPGQIPEDNIGQPVNMLQRSPTGQPIPVQPQPVQPTPAIQPQFGLSGAEQAMQAGLGAGVSAIEQGVGGALGTLQQGQNLAQQQLQQGQQSALSMLGRGANALGGNFSASAANVDPMTGQPLFQQAAQGVQAFSPAGLQAQEMQAALSGLRGQEAFNQALINSPAQQFLREQGERAVINQATALGGLGGGNVLQELQRQGQGLAATQLQQQINNLAGLSGQGLQAAGMGGQFLSQAGQQQGNLAAQNAQLATQANLANAENRLRAAQGQANLFGQGAGIASALAGQGAGLTGQFAGQGAGLQGQAGLNAANLFSGTGQNLAQARLQAGRDIASQIANTTGGLSQLQQQQGGGLADIIGSGGANLANLLSGAGQLTGQQQMQLAQLLANLSTGQGSQLAGLQGQIGQAQAGGITGGAAGLREGLGRVGGLLGGLF